MAALQGGAALSIPCTPKQGWSEHREGSTHLGSICHALVCRRKKSKDQLLQGLGDG